jgi:DNA-damage-inducible protein J
MASETVVRASIDGQVKEKVAKVLADMGLSVSDAIRLLLVRVAVEKALPFEIKVPNAETRAAMGELERGAGASFKRGRPDGRPECGGLSAPLHSNATTAGSRRYPATVGWTSGWSPCWSFWSTTARYRLGTATMR